MNRLEEEMNRMEKDVCTLDLDQLISSCWFTCLTVSSKFLAIQVAYITLNVLGLHAVICPEHAKLIRLDGPWTDRTFIISSYPGTLSSTVHYSFSRHIDEIVASPFVNCFSKKKPLSSWPTLHSTNLKILMGLINLIFYNFVAVGI